MKKRLLKALVVSLAAVLCLLSLASCGQRAQNWDGTFYQYLDETHFYAFEITVYGASEPGDSIDIKRMDCEVREDGEYGTASAGWGAYLKKADVTDDDMYRYKLKGDTLTVTLIDQDLKDTYAELFEGTYTRGGPMPNPDITEGGLHRYAYYSLDGDPDALTLLFYSDQVAMGNAMDTEYAGYTEDGQFITIEAEEGAFTLEVMEDGTLVSDYGDVFIMEE